MTSNEFPVSVSELDIADLEPTQEQLLALHNTILAFEAQPEEPFDEMPEGISLENLSQMEVYSDGPNYDEALTSSSLYKTPDGRVIWISVFRNSDTNNIVNETITITNPTANYESQEKVAEEGYGLKMQSNGKYALYINGDIKALKPEVEYIQTLLDISKPFDPFE